MDETGWRPLGGAARSGASSRPSRLPAGHRRPPRGPRQGLLADTKAIVTSDRWWAYNHLPLRRRQICWSHLQRDFKAHAEGMAAEKELGEPACGSASACSGPGRSTSTPTTAAQLQRHDPAAAARAQTDPAPLLRQNAPLQGQPRLRPQPAEGLARALDVRRPARTSSRPTTTPNAACAAPSSTANSPSAASPTPANNASHACSPPTRPADYNAGRSTPTSPNASPPTTAATRAPAHLNQGTERLRFGGRPQQPETACVGLRSERSQVQFLPGALVSPSVCRRLSDSGRSPASRFQSLPSPFGHYSAAPARGGKQAPANQGPYSRGRHELRPHGAPSKADTRQTGPERLGGYEYPATAGLPHRGHFRRGP